MAKSTHSDSELSSLENYDELDQDQRINDVGEDVNEELDEREDDDDEEDAEEEEEDGEEEEEEVEEDEEEDEEEEEEEDDEEDDDEEEEEEEEEELSEQEEPISSEEEEEGDTNFHSDDDFEEEEKPKKQKFKLNLRLSRPKEDTPYTDEESNKKPVRAKRRAAEHPKSKRPVGRPRRATQTAVNYKDYKYLDDKQYLSDDDIIPTPALDAEGLSDDEQETQQDPTKMTERQRAKLLDDESSKSTSKFLSLGNRTYNKPKRMLTEEENQLRKAEIARKRKNLTEKKLEEEKQETINKLLKRRAAKTSSKTKDDDVQDEDGIREKPRRPQFTHPALFSWKSTKDSIILQIPEPLAKKINSK